MIRISDAELEVMKVIWKRKKATSVEIIEDLKDFTWNFNTIRTLIKRLQVKGAIEVSGKEGKMFTYVPKIDEVKYKNEVTLEFIKRFYNNSISEFVLKYCKMQKSDLTKEKLEELMAKIDTM